MSICGKSSFDRTRWSVVLAAGDGTDTEAHAALSTLCKQYWYPLYAFVRRQGRNAADAQDLTQGFFLKLLEKDYLGRVDRSKGRFRTFLLTALRRFMAGEWDAVHASKRGGGQVIISIDDQEAESRYQRELCHDITPEKLYDRHWALALLELDMLTVTTWRDRYLLVGLAISKLRIALKAAARPPRDIVHAGGFKRLAEQPLRFALLDD